MTTPRTRFAARAVAQAQYRALARTRRLAEKMLEEVESACEGTKRIPVTKDSGKKHLAREATPDLPIEFSWDAKDSPLTALVKLTQLLLKIIPAEREAERHAMPARASEKTSLRAPAAPWSLEELALLERFVSEQRHAVTRKDEVQEG